MGAVVLMSEPSLVRFDTISDSVDSHCSGLVLGSTSKDSKPKLGLLEFLVQSRKANVAVHDGSLNTGSEGILAKA